MGNLIDRMATLRTGENLLIGGVVVLPSVVQIEKCDPSPASADIPYWQLWQEELHELDISKIKETWGRQWCLLFTKLRKITSCNRISII